MKTRFPGKMLRYIREYVPVVTFLIVTLVLRSAVADWNDIPSGSMEPTLLIGDRIFVNKIAYNLRIPFTMETVARWDTPKRGDIVVFMSPKDGIRLVKRVVGTPGDVIEMRNEHLYINGEMADLSRIDGTSYEKVLENAGNKLFFKENLTGTHHTVVVTPYLPAMRSFGPITVPEHHYLMLGDNRDNSADSRYFGFVPEESIVGKVKGVAFSLQYDHYFLPRGERFFSKVD